MSKIDEKNIHIQLRLTDNLVLDYGPDSPLKVNGFATINRENVWAVIGHVYITTEVSERLDGNRGPAYFAGHMRFETSPFTLSWYAANQDRVYGYVKSEIAKFVELGQYYPITGVAYGHTIKLPETF